MSGGGSKPRGDKMGTSIRATVSGESVADAKKELSDLVESLSTVRSKLNDAVRRYRDSEKAISPLEMELAKGRKEIDSLKLLLD
ncbi:Structural maintenance of chromosomes protein 4 [Castilleja foliolosa]|uniref:Structural maintenance of chromosomes protein 4 n=1 Tax=Castilleja foliolosa TaxID=1961234 RepID=A0ABD3CJD7_9LAMI